MKEVDEIMTIKRGAGQRYCGRVDGGLEGVRGQKEEELWN